MSTYAQQQQQQRSKKALVAAVTGAVNNGSGLIRVTLASSKFRDGDRVTISGVNGTTEANGVWTLIRITATTFDLTGSAFSHAYTSGGTARRG